MPDEGFTPDILKYLGGSGVTAVALFAAYLYWGKSQVPALHHENKIALAAIQTTVTGTSEKVDVVLDRVSNVEVQIAQLRATFSAHDKQDDERWAVYRQEHLRLQDEHDRLRGRVDRISEKT